MKVIMTGTFPNGNESFGTFTVWSDEYGRLWRVSGQVSSGNETITFDADKLTQNQVFDTLEKYRRLAKHNTKDPIPF